MKGKKTSNTGRTGRASAKSAARKAATKKAAGPITLPAECMIAGVDELKTTLTRRLALESNVTIDAAAVQRIDTASLQLLAAFIRDRRAAGLPFEWAGVTRSVTDAAELLNLSDTLGLPA